MVLPTDSQYTESLSPEKTVQALRSITHQITEVLFPSTPVVQAADVRPLVREVLAGAFTSTLCVDQALDDILKPDEEGNVHIADTVVDFFFVFAGMVAIGAQQPTTLPCVEHSARSDQDQNPMRKCSDSESQSAIDDRERENLQMIRGGKVSLAEEY